MAYNSYECGLSLSLPPSLPLSLSLSLSHTHTGQVNSKEGFLTKLGYHRKNWKIRWFTLVRNELKYFNTKDDKVWLPGRSSECGTSFML